MRKACLLIILIGLAATGTGAVPQMNGTLNGTLLDPSGAAISSSIVRLRWNDLSDEMSWDGVKREHKTPKKKEVAIYTDMAGRFSVDLFPGAWDVLAYRDGFVPTCTVVYIEPGKKTAVELRYPRSVRTTLQ
jgi:hypothetical protein